MTSEFVITPEQIQAAIARVASSSAFSGKETLQRLLAYLADKTLNDAAGGLKEYTIGVEVFGKPADYNPQEDASVRVQIGRLRQKLEEYHRQEGAGDPVIIELPKRQFALQFHPQTVAALMATTPELIVPTVLETTTAEPPSLPQPPRRRSWPLLLVGALSVTLLWAGWSLWQARPANHSQIARGVASLELQELWQPFLTSSRPVTMAIAMRPFLRYDRGVIFEWGLNQMRQESREARLAELQRQLDTRVLAPWERLYTTFGEAHGIFLLTRLFEGQHRDLQLKRHNALTWEEIAEQDIIFIGAGKSGVPFERLPVKLAFEQTGLSIINLQPKNGEPAEFITPQPTPPDFLQQEDYALISSVPGLHGKGVVLAFGASSSSALSAAVQYMTDPRYARELIAKLKGGQAALPRYYQVVIHARFQSLVPVEISYVTHREL